MKQLLIYFENKLNFFFERVAISSAVNAVNLGHYRMLFGLSLLIYFLSSWQWLSEVPESFFNPHILSFANFFNDFPSPTILLTFDIAVLILAIFITLGIFTRISLLTLFLISSIGYSFSYSFGKIDHGTTLYLFGILSLAYTNCGCYAAILKDKLLKQRTQNLALSALAIIICFGMFTAGLSKFIKWFDFDLSENGFLKWFYTGYYMYGRDYFLAETVLKAPYWFLEIADHLAPALELLGFYFLFRGKNSWRAYLTMICIFHLGNLLLLNIPFTLNVLIYGIFLIAPHLENSLNSISILEKLPKKLILVFFSIVLGIYHFLKRISLFTNTTLDLNYENLFVRDLYISLVLWLIVIFSGITLLFKTHVNLRIKN